MLEGQAKISCCFSTKHFLNYNVCFSGSDKEGILNFSGVKRVIV
jgi:hypothetical protein